jgi:hypothetical protein
MAFRDYLHWHNVLLAVLLAAIAADIAFGLDPLLNAVSTILLVVSALAVAGVFALAAAVLCWITVRDLIGDIRTDRQMRTAWRWKLVALAGISGILVDGAIGAWNVYQKHILFSASVEAIPFAGAPVFLLLASYPFRWIEQYLEGRKERSPIANS